MYRAEHAKINQVFCYKDAKENGKWRLEYYVARADKKVLDFTKEYKVLIYYV